ncbi:MAG TPA: hypothetical protein VHW46_06035 [Terracidiphilus sp.]|jgi:hypothetical protein|nr:hypothetical protein [Terracidiphilus sp.]
MNDQVHEPAYRAAIDAAHSELRQLAEALSRLHVRQEQIYAAVDSLKQLVSASEPADRDRRPAPAAKPPVLTMSNPSQTAKRAERVQALA